jgi:WD40 repeat protein
MDVAADRLATGSQAGRVSVWNWDGRLLHRFEHGVRVDHVAITPGTGLLATAAADRTLCTWQPDGRPATRTTLARPLIGLRFRTDGTGLMTIDDTGQVATWDPTAQEGTP